MRKKLFVQLKRNLRDSLPTPILTFIQNLRNKDIIDNFKNKSIKKNFDKVYYENLWTYKNIKSGEGSQGRFLNFSVKLIKKKKYINNKIVCSIGCGDFNFGRKIFKLSKNYIGIDIVRDLINLNRKKFKSKKLKFEHLNAINGKLPFAEVYIIRQVFQHLKNENIKKILSKIFKAKPLRVIVFEDVPKTKFRPNVDLPVNGYLTRHYLNSGIDLRNYPFDLKFKKIAECKSLSNKNEGKLVCYIYEKKKYLNFQTQKEKY